MPRRVPTNLDERVDHMIQIWEKIGAGEVISDLSLKAIRDKIEERQKAKDSQLMTEAADNQARTALRVHDEEIYAMTVQTMQVASVMFGPDSPEYKMAGGTPLSERGRGRKNNTGVPAADEPPPQA